MEDYIPAQSLALQTKLVFWPRKPGGLDGECRDLLSTLANLCILQDEALVYRLDNVRLRYALWLRTSHPFQSDLVTSIMGQVQNLNTSLMNSLEEGSGSFKLHQQERDLDQVQKIDTKLNRSFEYIRQLLSISSSAFSMHHDEAPFNILTVQEPRKFLEFLSCLDIAVEDVIAMTQDDSTDEAIAAMLLGVMETLTQSELLLVHNSGFSSRNCICEAARLQLGKIGVKVDKIDDLQYQIPLS